MQFLYSLAGLGGSALGYVLPFLFVLTMVVFFHELGHFLMARACGVAVEAFSIGFGPEITGWYDRHGTRWRVSWLPLGGYVKFAGDRGPTSTPDDEALADMDEAQRLNIFHFKPVWQRMLVVAAGPFANFILAIAIFAIMFMSVGQQISSARVATVVPGSAAEAAGFQPGDLVVAIDGHAIDNFDDMRWRVANNPDVELEITVRRGDQDVVLKATPRRHETKDPFGNIQRIGELGIARDPNDVRLVRMGPVQAVSAGVSYTYFVVDTTLTYIWRMVIGQESTDQLSGPLGIAKVSSQAAQLGFLMLIQVAALMSISIGLLNLFPVPLLDGGHLLYYGLEALRGRPLKAETQEFGFRIGLTAVISLMLFVTWNDLVHLRVVQFLTSLFS